MRKQLILLLILVFALQVQAQTEKRLALVIGNSAYQSGGALKNPVNDANLMTQTLQGLDFTVIKETDASLVKMNAAFRQFVTQMANYDVVLFFYAGHGMQVDGVNYLMPVDAKADDPMSLAFEAFDVSNVNKYFAQNRDKMNIMILDACRDNPYRSWSRGGERGFKALNNQGAGTIISFATSEGQTASDGTGSNGLFTTHLVKQMKISQNITDVFQNTRINVLKASNNRQVPQEWNMLTSNFYFTKGTNVSNPSDNTNTLENTTNEMVQQWYETGKVFYDVGNYKEAISWYLKAAVQGNPNAQYNLGRMYQFGKGVMQNYTVALNWYRNAADQGNSSAQYDIGLMYNWGLGMTQDFTEALNWYRKAAERGDPNAQVRMGDMYEYGVGEMQSYSEAIYWYRKAADQEK